MQNSAIGLRAFLEGFTQGGLFGAARMPDGGEVLVEETTKIEESQFRDLLMPFLVAKEGVVNIVSGQAEAIYTDVDDVREPTGRETVAKQQEPRSVIGR